MTSSAAMQADPEPIKACTVSRDVQNFELLVVDMEVELGEAWGDLAFEDARDFLNQPDADDLEFLAIAVDEEDEKDLDIIGELVRLAKEKSIKVVLIADEVSPIALHQLLRLGADDFVPYPLPDGALHDAIERISKPAAAAGDGTATGAAGEGGGVILPVHGVAGGTGATTFAVNLAWELANAVKKDGPRVCLLDLDFQFGTTSTFLDLPRRDAIFEILSDIQSTDTDAFIQSLQPYNDKLYVFTAPADIIPLDFVGPEEISRLIDLAQKNFDFVVIDMPSALVQWTETVLSAAHVYFTTIELDMRSAQNTLRLMRALKGEDLPFEKLRYVLNRAPGFTDLTSKSRVKRMAESLDIEIEILIPDGGKQVLQAGDHGQTLQELAGKSPVRKEIQKIAKQLYELGAGEEAAQA